MIWFVAVAVAVAAAAKVEVEVEVKGSLVAAAPNINVARKLAGTNLHPKKITGGFDSLLICCQLLAPVCLLSAQSLEYFYHFRPWLKRMVARHAKRTMIYIK